MGRRRSFVAALVATVAVAACGDDGGEGAGPGLHVDPAVAGPEIDAVVPDALRSANVPGAAVALVVDGEVAWSAGYGVTAPSGAPIDASTVFQVGSISKPVAAATILRLADEGVLDLDAPVASLLASWRLPATFTDPDEVTLRRLLSHTAGVNTGGYLGVPAGAPIPTLVESLDGHSSGTDEGPVAQAFDPGEFHYSGGGYSIAQLAAEDRTGERWAALARRELFDPLALPSAGYACTSEGPVDGPAVLAAGHDADGLPTPLLRYPEQTAAGLCADVDDIGRFAAWLTSDDPVATRMREAADGTGGDYGLGLELHGGLVGHDGVNRGFNAILRADPATASAVVVLTNGDNGRQVVDAVLALLRP